MSDSYGDIEIIEIRLSYLDRLRIRYWGPVKKGWLKRKHWRAGEDLYAVYCRLHGYFLDTKHGINSDKFYCPVCLKDRDPIFPRREDILDRSLEAT